jgi:gliding motility-associated-like protein
MIIFSRWGQQLFKTTNMDLGWDGKINGQDAPAGLYSYIISYKSLEDKEYTKRGTVTLVR